MLCSDCLPPDSAQPWQMSHDADARKAGADPGHVDDGGNCALVLAVT